MTGYTAKWIVFMIKVPSQISSLFESVLEQHAIPLAERASYRKWLQYYLDFCHKYRFNPAEEKSRNGVRPLII